MKSITEQRGFALATGLMFLLVLTLIAIVAMQGTKLELAMTTAVTRQEQAFEMTELSRVVARQSQAFSLDSDGRTVKNSETNLPTFTTTACNFSGGGAIPIAGASQIAPSVIRGWNCSTNTCMGDRIQNMDAVANLWEIGYLTCSPAPFRGAGGLVKLSVDNGAGRDAQAGQDEVPVLVTAFGRGSTNDGGSATSIAFFTVKTSR